MFKLVKDRGYQVQHLTCVRVKYKSSFNIETPHSDIKKAKYAINGWNNYYTLKLKIFCYTAFHQLNKFKSQCLTTTVITGTETLKCYTKHDGV